MINSTLNCPNCTNSTFSTWSLLFFCPYQISSNSEHFFHIPCILKKSPWNKKKKQKSHKNYMCTMPVAIAIQVHKILYGNKWNKGIERNKRITKCSATYWCLAVYIMLSESLSWVMMKKNVVRKKSEPNRGGGEILSAAFFTIALRYQHSFFHFRRPTVIISKHSLSLHRQKIKRIECKKNCWRFKINSPKIYKIKIMVKLNKFN